MYSKTEAQFRRDNKVKGGEWEIANIPWETLRAIGEHHEGQRAYLQLAAEGMARHLQSIDLVHSVRIRVKETDHLLKKIVRKRVEGSAKYADISVDNYEALVTDLVGVRALHLFKDDLFRIDALIRDGWTVEELPVVAYVRGGDSEVRLREAGFDVKGHKDGYRSVHYIVSTSPQKKKVMAEIQVRTIFEEGWAEIDHNIKYPDLSEDESVAEFLRIFNRLAGAADEMGGFVRRMADSARTVKTWVSVEEDAFNRLKLALGEVAVGPAVDNRGVNQAIADAIEKTRAEFNDKWNRDMDATDSAGDATHLATFLRFTGNFHKKKDSDKTSAMYESFRISVPDKESTGDFLSFTVHDGDKSLPGRISGTALAVLRKANIETDFETFANNHERIRRAAFEMRRSDPSLELIALGSDNF